MPGRKNSSKERKTAVASTVSPIDPKEQLQAEMRSLGYVEGLFIYTLSMRINFRSSLQFNIRVFLLCRFDRDIFTRNLEASVEHNMWGGKGPQRIRYIDYCTWAYAPRTYAVSARVFRHPSSETLFFFF